MTALIDGKYEIPVPLILQSLILTSVTRERRSGWSSDIVHDVNTESRDCSHSLFEAPS